MGFRSGHQQHDNTENGGSERRYPQLDFLPVGTEVEDRSQIDECETSDVGIAVPERLHLPKHGKDSDQRLEVERQDDQKKKAAIEKFLLECFCRGSKKKNDSENNEEACKQADTTLHTDKAEGIVADDVRDKADHGKVGEHPDAGLTVRSSGEHAERRQKYCGSAKDRAYTSDGKAKDRKTKCGKRGVGGAGFL